ncbi:hypothetical protein [Candidatus Uabimicrobium sp. HlEnr_7]|uniref:hypothetical protein n=1 Tax=Candidatus Uabimicrobium helgolandensis TaxID=3095367 RepID=UPI003558CCA1
MELQSKPRYWLNMLKDPQLCSVILLFFVYALILMNWLLSFLVGNDEISVIVLLTTTGFLGILFWTFIFAKHRNCYIKFDGGELSFSSSNFVRVTDMSFSVQEVEEIHYDYIKFEVIDAAGKKNGIISSLFSGEEIMALLLKIEEHGIIVKITERKAIAKNFTEAEEAQIKGIMNDQFYVPGLLMGAMLYITFVSIHFTADMQKFMINIFGSTVFGIPTNIVDITMAIFLNIPMFFLGYHLMKLAMISEVREEYPPVMLAIFLPNDYPQIGYSKKIVFFSAIYFLLMFLLWGFYMHSRFG